MSEVKSIIERAVRIEEQRKVLAEDLKELYAEAKANGHDVPALKLVVKEQLETDAKRKKREAAEEIADVYRRELGQLADTPLGNAAAQKFEQTEREARAARSKQRLSESMDDNKAMSAELVKAGLITPEAHAENVRLSDGIATKLGAGVKHYTSTPVPAAAEIDLTIPAFLRKGTPENAAIGDAS